MHDQRIRSIAVAGPQVTVAGAVPVAAFHGSPASAATPRGAIRSGMHRSLQRPAYCGDPPRTGYRAGPSSALLSNAARPLRFLMVGGVFAALDGGAFP